MTTVLDAHAVAVLSRSRQQVAELISRGQWPPLVPADVLTECLTGDHRRDFHPNRLLRTCDIRNVTEVIARHAAYLRTSAGQDAISATDAIVVALADHAGGGVILTSDLDDLTTLASHGLHPIRVARV